MARGVAVDPCCGVCGTGLENSWHSFVSCRFAEQCWSQANLGQILQEGTVRYDSFLAVLDYFLKIVDEEKRSLICMVLWQIWRVRNMAVWENKFSTPMRSVMLAQHCRNEWLAARNKGSEKVRRERETLGCKGWHDLETGWFWCGVDAAFFSDRNATGVGIIIRDAKGAFVAAKVLSL